MKGLPVAHAAVDAGAAESGRSGGALQDLPAVASGWLLNLAGIVTSAAFAFAFSIIVARGLGAEGAGVFFAASAVFFLVETAALLGAPQAVVRMLASFRSVGRVDDLRAVLALALGPALVASIILAIALFVLAPQLAGVVVGNGREDTAATYFRVLAPFLPLAVAYDTLVAATRGLGAVVPFVAIEKFGVSPARVLLALASLGIGFGTAGIALAWQLPVAIAAGAAGLVVLSLLRRIEREEPTRQPRTGRGLGSEFWRFSGPLGLAGVMQVTIWGLDVILLAALASAADAGVYKAAASLIVQGTFAQQAIILVISPILSGLLAQAEHERARSVFKTATWWIMVIAWPFYITLAVFAPLLMELFGADFVAGAGPLRIVAVTMLLATAAGPATMALVMGGRSSWNLLNAAAATVSNVVLNLLLIPPLEMTGAAIAWATSIVIANVAPAVQIRRFNGLSPFGAGFVVVASASAALYGGLGMLVWAAFPGSVTAFVALVGLATGAYAFVLWLFRRPLNLSFLRDSARLRRMKSQAEPA